MLPILQHFWMLALLLCMRFLCFQILTNASRRLHNAMLRAVMATRMQFFHFHTAGEPQSQSVGCLPRAHFLYALFLLSGQIINRFSKDTGQVDDIMAPAVAECLSVSLFVCNFS